MRNPGVTYKYGLSPKLTVSFSRVNRPWKWRHHFNHSFTARVCAITRSDLEVLTDRMWYKKIPWFSSFHRTWCWYWWWRSRGRRHHRRRWRWVQFIIWRAMEIVGRCAERSKILSNKLYILLIPNSIHEFAASKLSSVIWHVVVVVVLWCVVFLLLLLTSWYCPYTNNQLFSN